MPRLRQRDAQANAQYMREYRQRRKAAGLPLRDSSTPEENRAYLLKRYRLTSDEYDALMADQQGQCAICRTDITGTHGTKHVRAAAKIDHCHATGIVRGLLCSRCNTGIGQFKDSTERLAAAIRYLSKP